MDLKKYVAKSGRTVEIDLGDGFTVDVTYNNAAATPRFFKDAAGLSKAAEKEDITSSLDGMIAIIIGLVTDWSFTLGGKPLPVTADAAQDIPVEVLTKVVETIFADQNPGND